MQKNEKSNIYLSPAAVLRIQAHIKHLVKTYFKVAERHINAKNEGDLEEFAKTLMAFSTAIGAHIRAQSKNSGDEKMVTDQEMDFYNCCLKLTKLK